MTEPPDGHSEADELTRWALGRAARDGGPACLDAESLAAYYERSLDAAERTHAEAHVAGCLACQAALAALVQSEPEPAPPPAPAAGWLAWVAPRLAWAAPVVVAGVAAAVWYAQRPAIAPRQETVVASRALADEKAAAPADAERLWAEAPKPAETPPTAIAPESAAPPAAPRREAVNAVAAERPAEGQRAATREKSEERVEPRANVAGRAAALAQVATDAAAPAAPLVAAPGGQVVWRLGPGGLIARSDDAGATWRDQAATGDDLRTGAAVSPTICWLAGGAGAVWRTTDGERWQQVAVPADADLVEIAATGADQAIVTTAGGRRWETIDGGLTWFEKVEIGSDLV